MFEKQGKMILDVLCSWKSINPIQPQPQKYVCKMCKYQTIAKNEYDQHKKTTSHINNHNKIEKEWMDLHEALLFIC